MSEKVTNIDTENNLTMKDKIGYGAGDAGGVVTLVIIQSYMTRYVTNILEVPYATLSILLLIWNIWDTVNDPMVGALMDKLFERQKPGSDKFRPWIRASIPLILFGLISFFTVPGMLNGLWAVVALFILKIVYELGYTMMNIGMGSLLGAMGRNDTERSALSSARGIGSTIGHLIANFMIPQILAALGETKQGYAAAGIACAVLGSMIIYLHYAWTEERNAAAELVVEDEGEGAKFSDIFDVFKKNRAFLALSLHSIIIVFGTTVYNQIAPYMYADVLGDIGLMGISQALSMILTLIILTIAPKIVEKIGGTVILIRYGLILGIILFISLFLVMTMTSIPVGPMLYLLWSSIAYALINLSVQMQWGLVSESIDYNEYITGKRTEGSIYGTFSLTRRIGQTISQSLIVLMIGWIGYNPDLTNQGLAQADGTIAWLQILALLVPAIAAFGSWFCFKFIWNIDDKLRVKISEWRYNRLKAAREASQSQNKEN